MRPSSHQDILAADAQLHAKGDVQGSVDAQLTSAMDVAWIERTISIASYRMILSRLNHSRARRENEI